MKNSEIRETMSWTAKLRALICLRKKSKNLKIRWKNSYSVKELLERCPERCFWFWWWLLFCWFLDWRLFLWPRFSKEFYRTCNVWALALGFQLYLWVKVENISKGSLDSNPSPSPSVKIQIMDRKGCLRCKGKTLLGDVNKHFVSKYYLLTLP